MRSSHPPGTQDCMWLLHECPFYLISCAPCGPWIPAETLFLFSAFSQNSSLLYSSRKSHPQ